MSAHAADARSLVAGRTWGALSTVAVDPAGVPFGSLVTYWADDRGRPCFFLSRLAEHTRNLDADRRASLLVVGGGAEGTPLAAPRVTLLGEVGEVVDAGERASIRAGFLQAHPDAGYIDFADFGCLRLAVHAVRYVGGFGRMSWVDAADYAGATGG